MIAWYLSMITRPKELLWRSNCPKWQCRMWAPTFPVSQKYSNTSGTSKWTNWFRTISTAQTTTAQMPSGATYQADFRDYGEFLASLEMTAEIGSFLPVYLERITQLINKTNQFNLTTRRYTSAEVESIAQDPSFITLYGRLADRFGDNGSGVGPDRAGMWRDSRTGPLADELPCIEARDGIRHV